MGEHDQLKEIIQRCAKQDRAAQKELFELLYGKMLGVCMRYTKDRDRAQEVVQEGFIKVFDKLGEFDFEGSFEGWVRRIMVNAQLMLFEKGIVNHLQRMRNMFLMRLALIKNMISM